MFALLALMSRRLKGINAGNILQAGWQTLASTLVMALGIYLWLSATRNQPAWLIALGGILIGALLFVGIALLIGNQEIRSIGRELSRRAFGKR
jgi:uncharacterized oligopeptide transporter (OPT) family protein